MKKIIALLSLILIFNCSSDSDETPIPICNTPTPINLFSDSPNSITFQWTDVSFTQPVLNYTVEYGISGFAIGSGTIQTANSPTLTVNNLQENTSYDFYVRTNCSVGNSSNYSPVISATTEENCHTPQYVDLWEANTCSIDITWDTSQSSSWQIEYGESGFALGTGTTINTSDDGIFRIDENILPDTTYEIYVRSFCGSDGYSSYSNALVVSTEPVTFGEITGSFTGDYYIEDVSATIGPGNGTQNFESRVVTLTSIPFEETKKVFDASVLPGFISSDIEITIEFDVDSTVRLSEDVFTSISCNGGASLFRLTGIGANISTFEACDDSYVVINYVEDPDGSCGGPYQSSFSLTKL